MKPNSKIYISFIVFSIGIVQETNAALSTFDFTSPIEKTDVGVIVTDSLKWLLGFATSIALVALIIAGISYMTSTGDMEKAKKAKKAVGWILAGLILILLSYSILIVFEGILVN